MTTYKERLNKLYKESIQYTSAFEEARDLFSLCYEDDEVCKHLFFSKASEMQWVKSYSG